MRRLNWRLLFTLMNALSLNRSISFFYSIYENRFYPRIFFYSYLIWAGISLLRALVFVVCFEGKCPYYHSIETWADKMVRLVGSKYMIYPMICFLLHSINVFYFASRTVFESMKIHYDDVRNFFEAASFENANFLDCLFGWTSRHMYKQKIQQLSRTLDFYSNPSIKPVDKIKIMKYSFLAEVSYFSSALILTFT